MPSLPWSVPLENPAIVRLDDKAAHTAMIPGLLLFVIGPAEKEKIVGHIAERDPHLFAVQYPVVAVAFGLRSHPDHVRSGIRLGQAKGRELFAFCLRDEIFLFLLFSSPACKR